MLRRTERTLENLPVGPLGFIPITGCEELGKNVDDYLVEWRKESIDSNGQQISRRQQCRSQQDHRSQPAEHTQTGVQRTQSQIPLADETAGRRDTDQRS